MQLEKVPVRQKSTTTKSVCCCCCRRCCCHSYLGKYNELLQDERQEMSNYNETSNAIIYLGPTYEVTMVQWSTNFHVIAVDSIFSPQLSVGTLRS